MSCGWQSLKPWFHSLRTVVFTRGSCNRVCIASSKQNHFKWLKWLYFIRFNKSSWFVNILFSREVWTLSVRHMKPSATICTHYRLHYITSCIQDSRHNEEFKHLWRIKKSMKMFSKPSVAFEIQGELLGML